MKQDPHLSPRNEPTLRDAILSDPSVVLEDMDVMRALMQAHDATRGGNIIDMRGLAMNRLEERLGRLEDTHRTVISAAYENLAGTDQIHRAVLRLIETELNFETLVECLGEDIKNILRLASVRLVLETHAAAPDAIRDIAHLSLVPKGTIHRYITPLSTLPPQRTTMRPIERIDHTIYGKAVNTIKSEACLTLTLGAGCLPAMLVMGSASTDTFQPIKGSRLLEFFADVLERQLRHILA